ncbi:acyltransferase [Acidisphaera sp. L21]|uniref:acyltransferase family protein n=1 Tax=Acidisphaera sp. L21 TaxID=1641851 RepID=UPI00131DAEFC
MQTSPRLVALDHLRGFVVVLVVLHHAVLAYCHFGHTDRYHYVLSTAPVVDAQRWTGFDALVMLNDGFFMPLLFLLSGLFVWRGLRNRGAWGYFGRRALRLGLPFVTAAFTVVPLAYYPSWLQAGGVPGFARFWVEMVTTGPWPSGPPWFLGVLLGFNTTVALAYAAMRRRLPNVVEGATLAPPRSFGLFLMSLALAYLPLLFVLARHAGSASARSRCRQAASASTARASPLALCSARWGWTEMRRRCSGGGPPGRCSPL